MTDFVRPLGVGAVPIEEAATAASDSPGSTASSMDGASPSALAHDTRPHVLSAPATPNTCFECNGGQYGADGWQCKMCRGTGVAP
jgi:hypothetical protein